MNSRHSVKVGLPNGLLRSQGLLSWSGTETDLSHYVLIQHLRSVHVCFSMESRKSSLKWNYFCIFLPSEENLFICKCQLFFILDYACDENSLNCILHNLDKFLYFRARRHGLIAIMQYASSW